MGDVIDALILDLLEAIAPQPKPYAEVQRTWRTSCPRLPVWEEACERGFIERRGRAPDTVLACLTPRGRTFLNEHRPTASHGPH